MIFLYPKQLVEVGGSIDDFVNLVRRAFYRQFSGQFVDEFVFVEDVFKNYVVIRLGEKLYQAKFKTTDEEITFADRASWTEVELSYQPVTETLAVAESQEWTIPIRMSETTIDPQGNLVGTIVVEGRSDNGRWYSRRSIVESGKVFEGVPIFADHSPRTQRMEQPERSVHEVIGKVSETFVETAASGAAQLKFRGYISAAESKIRTKIREGLLGDMSLVAMGEGHISDQHSEFVVDRFVEAFSHDLVTFAAAGGKVEHLGESKKPTSEETTEEQVVETQTTSDYTVVYLEENSTEDTMSDKDALSGQIEQLLENQSNLTRQLRVQEADRVVRHTLEQFSELPESALGYLRESLQGLVQSYGGNDQTVEQLQEAATEQVKAFKEMLVKSSSLPLNTGILQEGAEPQDFEKRVTEAFKWAGDLPMGRVPTQDGQEFLF